MLLACTMNKPILFAYVKIYSVSLQGISTSSQFSNSTSTGFRVQSRLGENHSSRSSTSSINSSFNIDGMGASSTAVKIALPLPRVKVQRERRVGDSVMPITAGQLAKFRSEFDLSSNSAQKDVVNGKDRRPSFPFISGDGFRAICKYRCEEKHDGCSFSPAEVESGSLVYVQSDYLHAFAMIAHKIPNKFIVVTHNGDLSTPDGDDWHGGEGPMWSQHFSHLLELPNLQAWFASNCHWKGWPNAKPRRLICIPIGIENRYNQIGQSPQVYFRWMERRNRVKSTMPLLVAFSTHPLKPFRASAIAALTASWITRKNLERDAWFEAVQEHHFVACPIGHGYDTHRTWEVLLSGSIPIVESTSMDSMYENLPVLIVHRWSEVTQDLLKNVSHDFRLRDDLNLEKLFFGYWRDLIMAAVTKG
jgi:hypothetical protein